MEIGDLAHIKRNADLLERNPELKELLGGCDVRPSKYRNVKVQDPDGEVFDSGREAVDARNFTLAVQSGHYVLYRHNVTVKLPGGIKMRIDHFLVNNNLKVECFDTKAWDEKKGEYLKTRDWTNKAKLFFATYGIEVKLI